MISFFFSFFSVDSHAGPMIFVLFFFLTCTEYEYFAFDFDLKNLILYILFRFIRVFSCFRSLMLIFDANFYHLGKARALAKD